MNAFVVLLQKEWREAVRGAKLIWLPAVFVLLGLMQPISAKFMPDIIASAGNLPEGAVIQIPIPQPGEVLAQTLGQFSTIGLLAICLAFMGAIAGERRNGTADWILVKPVSHISYVIAKWLVQCCIIGLSFGVGYGAAWYYTNVLIGAPDAAAAVGSGLLYFVWLLFVASIVLAAGAWLAAPAGAAFVALGCAAGLQVLYGLFSHRLGWAPPSLSAKAQSALASGETAAWAGSAITAIAVIVLLLALAVAGTKSGKR